MFYSLPTSPPPQDSTVNGEKNWGANLRKQSLHLQFQCGPQRELLNSLRVILAQLTKDTLDFRDGNFKTLAEF